MRYVAVGVGFLLFLCVAAEHEVMNQASKTLLNVRELIRNTDPLDIIKNITTDSNITNHKKPNPMAIAVFKNLTSPANMKTYLRLVKESKIPKKGEIIKIAMRFMNPENLTPAGVIKTLKTLDVLTASELSVVNLQYYKVIIPQIVGNGYDKLFKYINENDMKELTRISFEIFKDTDSGTLEKFVERIRKDGKEAEKKADMIIHGKGELLVSDWQSNSDQKLRDTVNKVMAGISKASNFERSPKLPALINVFKKSTIHFLAAVVSDIQAGKASIDSKDLMRKATNAVKETSKTLSAFLEYFDFGELGTDAEKALIYIHNLDRNTAKDALGDLVKMLPPVDKIMNQIEGSDNVLLMKVDKVKLEDILFKVNKTKIPEPMINMGVDSFLHVVKHVDPKKTRSTIEFIVKEINNDNIIYKGVRKVIWNIFYDFIKKSQQLKVSGNTLDEIKEKVVNIIESVDNNILGNLADSLKSDYERLNVSLVAGVVTEANTVFKNLISNEVFPKIFTDPKSLLQADDKKTFFDMVYFNLDALKLVNETQLSRRCNDLANLASDDLKNKINNMSDWVDNQFYRVENGSEIIKKLNLDDIFDFISSALTSIDLKSTCVDVIALLRVNKVFTSESRYEIADLLWKAFRKVQKSVKSDNIDREALEKVQDVLEALLQAMVNSKSLKPDDFRTAGVRLAVRSVKEYGVKKGFKPVKTESEGGNSQNLPTHTEKLKNITTTPEPTTEAKTYVEPPIIREEDQTTQNEIIITEAPKHKSKIVFTRRPSRTSTPMPVFTEIVTKKIDKIKKEKNPIEKVQINRSAPDTQCSKHAEEVVLSLLSDDTSDDTEWVSKMLDATYQSRHTKMSNLVKRRECFSASPRTRKFTGQFCQAKVHMLFDLPERFNSSKQLFLNESLPYSHGICIPSSCTADDFTNLLKHSTTITGLSNFLNFTITPESCQIKTDEYILWDKICLIVLLVLICLSMFSTTYELHQRICQKNDQPSRFLCAFSLQTTVKQLFSTESDNDWVKAVDGIRTIATFWIILQASLSFTSTYGILNDSIDGMFAKEIGFIFPMNLYGASDLLLFCAGFLTARTFVRSVDFNGHFDLILTILGKYLRVTPCIAAVMIFNNGILRNRDFYGDDIQCNASNWWHSLAFIQNFIKDDKQCLPQGWLISLEVQLFVLSLIVLLLLLRFKRLRWVFTVFLLAVSIILPSTLIMMNKYTIMLFPTLTDDQFDLDMIKPYTRATPYMTGLLLGYFIFRHHFSKIKVVHSRVQWLTLTTISVASFMCCIFGAIVFLDGSKTRWGIAAYLMLSRLGISAAVGVLTYLCSHGYVGWFNDILSSGIFKVLGKLSFSAFLFYPFVIEMRLNRTTAAYVDDYTVVLGFISDCVVSYFLGLVFYLLVESPAANLKKSILARAKIMPVSSVL